MRFIISFLMVLAMSSMVELSAQTATDSTAIRATALNSTEGWHAANPERMPRSLHPGLTKRMVVSDEKTGRDMVDVMGRNELTAQKVMVKIQKAINYEQGRGKLIYYEYGEYVVQDFQSERTYPPYFSMIRTGSGRYNVDEGVEENTNSFIYPGNSGNRELTVLTTLNTSFMNRNSALVPIPNRFSISAMNAWLVLHDWFTSESEVQLDDSTYYRDYWRTVLVREGQNGTERLIVDPKTGFPMKYERLEKNNLWGYMTAEYQYSLWGYFDGIYYPRASFKVVNGKEKASRTVGNLEIRDRAKNSSLHIPLKPIDTYRNPMQAIIAAAKTDTMHIGGNTYLLKNQFYNEAVTLANDTVFVMDATMGWKRAQTDEEWIQKLYPGDYPVAVIVSDLAWPHISGVRYWVAKGATIISHRAAEGFLKKVIQHRWVVDPDPLEENRANLEFNFIPVDKRMVVGGGDLRIEAIDGIGSEIALIIYDRRNKFLWAGDFIQNLEEPKSYTIDVWKAVNRAGFQPDMTAAQHIPLTAWQVVDSLSTRK